MLNHIQDTGQGTGMRIYFAGQLFSEAERRFNASLTDRLEAAGCSVFLPQRDGAERDRPPYSSMTKEQRRAAMFALDTAEILRCDVFLIVLDGRVPDEGAAFELGVAYTCKRLQQPAKRLIGLHTDARAAFLGAKLNPMLAESLDVLVTDEAALLDLLTRLEPRVDAAEVRPLRNTSPSTTADAFESQDRE